MSNPEIQIQANNIFETLNNLSKSEESCEDIADALASLIKTAEEPFDLFTILEDLILICKSAKELE
jgi:hypothetical protein